MWVTVCSCVQSWSYKCPSSVLWWRQCKCAYRILTLNFILKFLLFLKDSAASDHVCHTHAPPPDEAPPGYLHDHRPSPQALTPTNTMEAATGGVRFLSEGDHKSFSLRDGRTAMQQDEISKHTHTYIHTLGRCPCLVIPLLSFPPFPSPLLAINIIMPCCNLLFFSLSLSVLY